MPYHFTEDGLYIEDSDGLTVAIFRFDNDWSLNTVQIYGGEIYNAEQGVEDERISQRMADEPDYGFYVFGSTQVLVFTRQIAFGPMYIICVSDAYNSIPSRMIAKVVDYEQPDYAKGEWEIALFDGDEEKEITYKLSKFDRENKYYKYSFS